MAALTSLIILAIIALGSLAIVSALNHHEEKMAIKKHYQQTMRQRAEELEELILVIDPLMYNRSIAAEINRVVIDKYRQIHAIEPSEYIAIALENASNRGEELSLNSPDRRVTYVTGSDAAIAQAQKKLLGAGRILKVLNDKGEINNLTYKQYMDELRWVYLEIEVMTYMYHGYKARQRGDSLTAVAFFKKSAEVLRTSGIRDDRRHQQIREVSEIIRGKRMKMSNQTNQEALLEEHVAECPEEALAIPSSNTNNDRPNA